MFLISKNCCIGAYECQVLLNFTRHTVHIQNVLSSTAVISVCWPMRKVLCVQREDTKSLLL